ALNLDALDKAPEADANAIKDIQGGAKKEALSTVAIFPAIMLVCYIILIFYFRSQGGYKPVELETREAQHMV
ncbi:MAG: MFS transporter, partial [Bacteroidota bacterium]